MAWTTPRTWVTGEVLTAANLNLHLRDDLNMLWLGPSAAVKRAATQSIPNATNTYVAFDTEIFDLGTNWDAGLPERLTAAIAGKFLISGRVNFATGTTGFREATIQRSDNTDFGANRMSACNTGDTVCSVVALVPMTAGQYCRLRVHQTQGVALNLNIVDAGILQLGATS
jgi:hypothetical protein